MSYLQVIFCEEARFGVLTNDFFYCNISILDMMIEESGCAWEVQ